MLCQGHRWCQWHWAQEPGERTKGLQFHCCTAPQILGEISACLASQGPQVADDCPCRSVQHPAQQVLPFSWKYSEIHKIMRLSHSVKEAEPSQLQLSCLYSNHFGCHGPQGTIVVQLMWSTFKCRAFFFLSPQNKMQFLNISKWSLKSKKISLWGYFSHFQNQAFSSKLF